MLNALQYFLHSAPAPTGELPQQASLISGVRARAFHQHPFAEAEGAPGENAREKAFVVHLDIPGTGAVDLDLGGAEKILEGLAGCCHIKIRIAGRGENRCQSKSRKQ